MKGGTATLQLASDPSKGTFTNSPGDKMVMQTSGSTFQTGSNIPQPLNNNTQLISAGTSIPGCTCEFMTWGAWASTFTDPRDSNKTYTALGLYIAGKLTPAVQMPLTGSATYNGSMVGIVRDHDASRAGAGSFNLSNYSFTSRSGTFNGNFDGKSFGGTVNGTALNPQNYNGSVSGSGVSGKVNGAFASSSTQPAAYTIGNFALKGPQYRASGIFAGQR